MSVVNTIKEIMNEANAKYKIWHDSYSSAVSEIKPFVESRGFTLDDMTIPDNDGDQLATKVGSGPKRPSKDKTNTFHFDLFKKNKLNRNKLHVQIYNNGKKYELNMYIR